MPPDRVHTHAAPTPLLSKYPPTSAVLPSAERATDSPCSAFPTDPLPTSLPPCWTSACAHACAGQTVHIANNRRTTPRGNQDCPKEAEDKCRTRFEDMALAGN